MAKSSSCVAIGALSSSDNMLMTVKRKQFHLTVTGRGDNQAWLI